jgi:ketosteroid isomerase-like protein
LSHAASAPRWVLEVLAAVDARDAARFANFIAEDGVFKFANAEPARGRAAIEAAVAGFFGTVRACHHRLLRCWQDGGDALAMQGTVSYTRLDGRELTLPFVNVFVMRGELIAEYLIYVDIAPLYAA